MIHKLRQSSIFFDGKFTPAIRNAFQRKRIELGLAYQRLGDFFGTNWSTIRKWELGPTKYCNICQRTKVEAFLNGCFDHELMKKQKDPLFGSSPQALPDSVYKSMEKFNATYHLLKNHPDLRDTLLKEINSLTSDTLQNLLEMHSANLLYND